MILALAGLLPGVPQGSCAQTPEEIIPRYFREVDGIHQRHNDAAEALVRQVRENQAKGQPVELLQRRLREIEDERARDLEDAERRLAETKARATAVRPALAPAAGTGAVSAAGARPPLPAGPARPPVVGAALAGPAATAAPVTREAVVVEGSGGATEIDFRRGEGAAPVQPGGAGEGVTEVQF